MAKSQLRFRTYRDLFRVPRMGSLLIGTLIARVPLGMGSVGYILFLSEQYHSFKIAGLMVGLYAAACALTAPWHGKFIDQNGAHRALFLATTVSVLASCIFLMLCIFHAPIFLLAIGAVFDGAAVPRVGASLRGIFSTLLAKNPERLRSAVALNSILEEMSYTLGPAFAALVASIFAPVVVLALIPALRASGIGIFLLSQENHFAANEKIEERSHKTSLIRVEGMRIILVSSIVLGVCFGSSEIMMSFTADQHGVKNSFGLMAAGFSIGGFLGSFVYGAASHMKSRYKAFQLIFWLVPIILTTWLFSTSPLVIGVLAFFLGIPTSAAVTALSELLEEVSPKDSMSEAYSWLATAVALGAAIGSGLTGVTMSTWSWQSNVLALTGLCVSGALFAQVRRLKRQELCLATEE